MIRIGAENIVCPMGESAQAVFKAARNGNVAVRKHHDTTIFEEPFVASMFTDRAHVTAESLAVRSLKGTLSGLKSKPASGRTLFILSTTKGEIAKIGESYQEALLSTLAVRIKTALDLDCQSIVISNACISGLLSVITAADLIATGSFDHAIICGVDLVSNFTVTGFSSLFALDEKPCKPFDADRKGINLGEGAASLVVTKDPNLLADEVEYLAGAGANDANHISGPSRTGEGLYRAIQKVMAASGVSTDVIGQISAHGTATRYNDDMESIALTRCGLGEVPVHSYKGYFGHTLGAAGLIELGLLLQSVRNQTILPVAGLSTPGTIESIDLSTTVQHCATPVFMKTASGFGGCNAAAIFRYGG